MSNTFWYLLIIANIYITTATVYNYKRHLFISFIFLLISVFEFLNNMKP